jgi:hypothetical protein
MASKQAHATTLFNNLFATSSLAWTPGDRLTKCMLDSVKAVAVEDWSKGAQVLTFSFFHVAPLELGQALFCNAVYIHR